MDDILFWPFEGNTLTTMLGFGCTLWNVNGNLSHRFPGYHGLHAAMLLGSCVHEEANEGKTEACMQVAHHVLAASQCR
jgi:hypothetical protein